MKQKCLTNVDGKYVSIHRHLPAFLDRPPAIAFSLSWHNSNLRGYPMVLDRISSLSLVFRIAHLLMLMAALKFRFKSSMYLLPPVELIDARIHRTRALCAITVSSSYRWTNIFSCISPYTFLLPLRHSLFFARWSARRGFSHFFLWKSGDTKPPGSPTCFSILFLGFLFLYNERTSFYSYVRTFPGVKDLRKKDGMYLGVTLR